MEKFTAEIMMTRHIVINGSSFLWHVKSPTRKSLLLFKCKLSNYFFYSTKYFHRDTQKVWFSSEGSNVYFHQNSTVETLIFGRENSNIFTVIILNLNSLIFLFSLHSQKSVFFFVSCLNISYLAGNVGANLTSYSLMNSHNFPQVF